MCHHFYLSLCLWSIYHEEVCLYACHYYAQESVSSPIRTEFCT